MGAKIEGGAPANRTGSGNLKPVPLFLTPQVVRGVLGIGSAKGMARVEIVALGDSGARCSSLRLNILRAIRSQPKKIGAWGVRREWIAEEVAISTAALDEHITALRACGCLHDRAIGFFMITSKGYQKLAFADAEKRRLDRAATKSISVPERIPTGPILSECEAGRTSGAVVESKSTVPGTTKSLKAPRVPSARDGSTEPLVSELSVRSGDRTPREGSTVSSGSTVSAELPESDGNRARNAVATEEAGERVASAPPSPEIIGPEILTAEKPKVDWITARRLRLEGAIRFLRSQAVLVQVSDNVHAIRMYRVSGKRDAQYAEDVIEIALAKGWVE